jgi:hypothetical protein
MSRLRPAFAIGPGGGRQQASKQHQAFEQDLDVLDDKVLLLARDSVDASLQVTVDHFIRSSFSTSDLGNPFRQTPACRTFNLFHIDCADQGGSMSAGLLISWHPKKPILAIATTSAVVEYDAVSGCRRNVVEVIGTPMKLKYTQDGNSLILLTRVRHNLLLIVFFYSLFWRALSSVGSRRCPSCLRHRRRLALKRSIDRW